MTRRRALKPKGQMDLRVRVEVGEEDPRALEAVRIIVGLLWRKEASLRAAKKCGSVSLERGPKTASEGDST